MNALLDVCLGPDPAMVAEAVEGLANLAYDRELQVSSLSFVMFVYFSMSSTLQGTDSAISRYFTSGSRYSWIKEWSVSFVPWLRGAAAGPRLIT